MYFKIYIGESENGLFGQNAIIIRKKGSFQVVIEHFDCDNDCLTKFTVNLVENLKILTSHLYAHGC